MDFTLKTYNKLLTSLIAQGYTFQTFAEFLENPAPRCIILRHDVEARYGNALQFAKIQHDLGVKGTYYFRFLINHYDSDIVRQIGSLGHEIGYHYDDLSHCHGNYEEALKRFEKNLATLREIAPVKTICMEGAPLSKYDNREMWRQEVQSAKCKVQSSVVTAHRSPFTVHYTDFGIIGEPYFDIDFSKVLYLTDTGRRWDGKGSVRDKVSGQRSAVSNNSKFQIPNSKFQTNQKSQNQNNLKTTNSETQTQHSALSTQNLKFHSTKDIITAAHLLPDRIMFTFHPQRWTDEPLPWLRELVMQNAKNVVKRWVVRG